MIVARHQATASTFSEEQDQQRPEQLSRELEALSAAGHVMTRWPVPVDEIPAELGIVRDVQHWACGCGVLLLAGWDHAGAFLVAHGVGGAYGPAAHPQAIVADLEARRHGPCLAAQALADFHASAGYQRFAECYNS